MSLVWFVLGMMAGGTASAVVLAALMCGSRGAPPEDHDALERLLDQNRVPASRGTIAPTARRRAPRLTGVVRPRASRRIVARF